MKVFTKFHEGFYQLFHEGVSRGRAHHHQHQPGRSREHEKQNSVPHIPQVPQLNVWREWLLMAWFHFKRMYLKPPSLHALIVPCASLSALQKLKHVLGRARRRP